jgi:16S rRNA (adenine1518-N6/adenine1519-N6)-dimethyltransferase
MIRSELEKYRISARKRLGQNFLINKSVRAHLIEYAQVKPNDTVLEVGAGTGFVTAALLKVAGRVVSIEADPVLASILRKKLGRHKNLTIIEEDALKIAFPSFNKLVSTPPYNISSKLILKLARARFERATLTLQDEFAQRLIAEAGTENYGRISVMAQHQLSLTLRELVPRSAFYPQPRVNSRIIAVAPRKGGGINVENEGVFAHLVRGLFTQRRRLLRGALKHYLSKVGLKGLDSLLTSAENLEARVFQLDVSDFENLANTLTPALRPIVQAERTA